MRYLIILLFISVNCFAQSKTIAFDYKPTETSFGHKRHAAGPCTVFDIHIDFEIRSDTAGVSDKVYLRNRIFSVMPFAAMTEHTFDRWANAVRAVRDTTVCTKYIDVRIDWKSGAKNYTFEQFKKLLWPPKPKLEITDYGEGVRWIEPNK